MLVVFVRRPTRDPRQSEAARDIEAVHPAELAAIARDAPTAEIAARAKGPFVPIARAPDVPALRERIARAALPKSVARFRRVRPWLLLGIFPVLALVDLERQLVALNTPNIVGRLAADLVLLVFMIFEIARPIPRHPRAWAIASLSVAARYAYMIAAMCGRGLPLFFLGLALSLGAAILALVAMPSGRTLARDARDALQIPVESPARAPQSIAWPLTASIALPAVLGVARAFGASTIASAAIFAVVGGALSVGALSPRANRANQPPLAIADAAAAGLACAIALVRCVHYATIAGSEAVRCAVGGASAEQAASNDASGRYAILLGAMAIIVVPIVEECVYRGTLQRALLTRTSRATAIAASSIVFGLAHVGVYGASIHHAILLGVAFGVAFEEGGLVAAIAAHALYNAAQLF